MSVTGGLIRSISRARQVAFEVLEEAEGGGYASDALLARGNSISARDAGLASQIVFGCLRFQAQLDWLIQKYSGRATEQLDVPVQVALRAAVFQLRHLDRIPRHAAVHESVEWVKHRKRAASGFVNAVLRKVNREPAVWPDMATELSCPAWLLESWTAQFGRETARRIGEAALKQPEQYVRVPEGAEPPKGTTLHATDVSGCFRLESPPPDGVRLQDIGSQAIIPLLDLRPGLSYLDLCAAPGNKTLQALETGLGFTVACDVSFSRICAVPPACPRVVLDAAVPLPFSRAFERVFIDAPCSGTGTLARNPEIKWRVQSHDLGRFKSRQIAILLNGVSALSTGGTLLYATCSLQAEENGQVVEEVLRQVPALRLKQELWRIPGRDEGDGFYAAVLG